MFLLSRDLPINMNYINIHQKFEISDARELFTIIFYLLYDCFYNVKDFVDLSFKRNIK